MRVEITESITKLRPQDWALIAPADFPFASYDFLHTLETTSCLGKRTGWNPFYLVCYNSNELVGACVVFLKSNSYGEYIFDFAWAQAFEHYGVNYYPKLVAAIPFTPATGPKLLYNKNLSDEEIKDVRATLLKAAQELLHSTKTSSLHALFITEDEITSFREFGFMIRHSFQYHWRNEGFSSFEQFLSRLRSKRRKEILRERKQAKDAGVKISRLTGPDLTQQHAEAMHQFYFTTVAKMGGYAYLTAEFFLRIFEKLRDHLLFVVAEEEGVMVAGALNYFSGNVLFGRHWGCIEEYKALHFELCYYQGIEFAIERKIGLFEAGAQGEHKFQRGFLPSLTYSAHHIVSEVFKEPIKHFIEDEKRQLKLLFRDYENVTPFSRAEDSKI